MTIRIFYENTDFRLKGWKNVRNIIEKVIANENRISGDLNFILSDDETIKEINNRFLKHNYYTDVITFDYNEQDIINGEVYVSLDSVRENANNYNVSLNEELVRVLIHGTLHLCGYNDKTDEEKTIMRFNEDKWLTVFKERN